MEHWSEAVHIVQSVGQLLHSLPETKVPSGQLGTHWPPYTNQPVAHPLHVVADWQYWQFARQGMQVPCARNVPGGQAGTQLPA